MEKYYLARKMCESEEETYRTYESYEQLTDLLVKDQSRHFNLTNFFCLEERFATIMTTDVERKKEYDEEIDMDELLGYLDQDYISSINNREQRPQGYSDQSKAAHMLEVL